MKTYDAQNERIKRRYLTFLKEAKRFSESSLDGVAKAIHRFESSPDFAISGNFISNRRSDLKRTSRSRDTHEQKRH
jgi:hypothetical protein